MREHISREAAWAALRRYNQEPFHLQHALTVEGVMQWYAKELGYGDDAEFWGIVGLLHDIDFERWPEEHCQKAPELLREAGCGEDIIHAVCSHGYGLCGAGGPHHGAAVRKCAGHQPRTFFVKKLTPAPASARPLGR